MKSIVKLGIVSGAGELPDLVVQAAKKQNIPFIIAAIKGFAKPKNIISNNYFWISLGQVGYLVNQFKEQGVSHVCFAGSVKRPSIFGLKLDDLGKELLTQYFKKIKGDDSLLKLVLEIFEKRFEFKVISPQFLDSSILSCNNFVSNLKPNKIELDDIKLGYKIAKEIGNLDIGQSVIIQQQIVIAVEGVEGTQNLIKRSKKLLKKEGSKGILIKVKKPHQEQRIDLPTIGLKTIKDIKKAGMAGIAIENGATLILNKQEILNYANSKGLFVTTINKDILE